MGFLAHSPVANGCPTGAMGKDGRLAENEFRNLLQRFTPEPGATPRS
jgi:hypothetical protein